MTHDIYTQGDLFDISHCKRQSTLKSWLHINGIPFIHDAKGRVIAHKTAVEQGFGVKSQQLPVTPAIVLSFD